MLKSLIWKEFRELLPLCAASGAAQFLLIAFAVNAWRLQNRADVYAVWPLLYITAILLAIAVGYLQNAREVQQNTFQFLLHRPVRREAVFGLKLLFGAAVCLVVSLLPLVCFSAWAESAFPNRTGPGFFEALWVLCAGIWLLYIGSFLSSLRPARWYGSRFFPLFAGIFLFVLMQALFSELLRVSAVWDTGAAVASRAAALALGPLLTLCFALASLHAGQARDFS